MKWFRSSGRIALAAGILITLVGANAVPAQAIDGRVPDSRAITPAGEITAYYWHGLDRDPDTGGLNNYLSFTNMDCRWGVLDAGIKLLDSGEMYGKWRTTEQKVGALYASLLNRGPDADGFNTYRDAINAHGMRWSISQMQASAEFQRRLNAICVGRKSSNANLWNSHDGMVQAIRINNGASELVKACGVGLLINTFAPLAAGVFKGAALAIRASKLAAGQVVKAGGSCVAAYHMLQAADTTASTASYEGANNAVFLEQDGRSYWNAIGRWCETNVRVGPNAMTWTGYKADYRC
jgi:hypothetical protein